MIKVKNDKYKKTRGGHSRFLDIACENCGQHVTFYQKDGPGMLKRMYVDRFIDYRPQGNTLQCEKCQHILGVLIIYEKENRPAYRLFVGAVTKKITSQNKVNRE